MKRIIILSILFVFQLIVIRAQDSRYEGTWKWHYDSPYEDGVEGIPPRDEYIRINIEDGKVWISIKIEGKDGNGHPFVRREEAEDISENSDGTVSFKRYICKNEYDNEDHLYWTVWTHYIIKYEGGRLKVSEETMGIGCNRSGAIVKDERDVSITVQKTYYNEKDNW